RSAPHASFSYTLSATSAVFALSLHDALPISDVRIFRAILLASASVSETCIINVYRNFPCNSDSPNVKCSDCEGEWAGAVGNSQTIWPILFAGCLRRGARINTANYLKPQ